MGFLVQASCTEDDNQAPSTPQTQFQRKQKGEPTLNIKDFTPLLTPQALTHSLGQDGTLTSLAVKSLSPRRTWKEELQGGRIKTHCLRNNKGKMTARHGTEQNFQADPVNKGQEPGSSRAQHCHQSYQLQSLWPRKGQHGLGREESRKGRRDPRDVNWGGRRR